MCTSLITKNTKNGFVIYVSGELQRTSTDFVCQIGIDVYMPTSVDI